MRQRVIVFLHECHEELAEPELDARGSELQWTLLDLSLLADGQRALRKGQGVGTVSEVDDALIGLHEVGKRPHCIVLVQVRPENQHSGNILHAKKVANRY